MEDFKDIISILFLLFIVGTAAIKLYFGDEDDNSPKNISPSQNNSSDFDEARKMVEEIRRRKSPVHFEEPEVVFEDIEEDIFAEAEMEATPVLEESLGRDYYAELKAIQESEAYQKSVEFGGSDTSLDESVEVKLASSYDYDLKTSRGLRAAIVASEIISKPLALRSDW